MDVISIGVLMGCVGHKKYVCALVLCNSTKCGFERFGMTRRRSGKTVPRSRQLPDKVDLKDSGAGEP